MFRKHFPTFATWLFGPVTIQSIIKPISKMQDDLDSFIFDMAAEENRNNEVIEELTARNGEINADTEQAAVIIKNLTSLTS
jgi:hypothetical protein